VKKLIILVSILVFVSKSYAASFDCTKAASLVENVICSDSEISGLDDAVSSSYKNALAKGNNIKQSQRNWLKTRNLCKSKVCLKKIYAKRLNELSDLPLALSSKLDEKDLFKKVGECKETTISKIGTRFEDSARPNKDTGTSISFANDIWLVDYDLIPQVAASKSGDDVEICLESIPKNCPPGDDRGKGYTVTNLRTGEHFTMGDSQHECGGA
jgi:uncharacterized protein